MNVSPSTVIKGIFALQLVIGAALVAGDMNAGLPTWSAQPRAPQLDQPVRPGDQTRRFQPQQLPDAPNRPFPPTADMPTRLMLSDAEFDGRKVVRMVGTIAPGDGERVAPLLAERFNADDAPDALLLHSPGGSVGDGLVLGRAVRDLGIATEIAPGDLCLSACPYLFAGGASRTVQPGGSLGVHQHYFGENIVQPAFLAVEDIQRGQGQVLAYLAEMGLDLRLMEHALMTPPQSIYIFVTEELERYGIVTPPEG
ncbi:hypothetical protein SAMN04488020_101322 [Palleronia marisminoris]|uniref:Periplasmic protein-like protein n=1 Tax=Palleronia marisminoris TaxID=315423 RepID=A0A1Y5REF4_9RHOB|nr:hypothetical protein [Palleronia marisminoris]SFG14966.1 hypothetical protein SAMN04488020_101322 [Palleronia marisminoris]SLN15523.1 hypothetical protein PAM7066_00322 [Palleronia marisminoris]